MATTTVRIPDKLHAEAKEAGINVSLACLHGIRIHLGLKCPILPNCNCFKKSETLQDLLLKSQEELEKCWENYKRLKNVKIGLEEERR